MSSKRNYELLHTVWSLVMVRKPMQEVKRLSLKQFSNSSEARFVWKRSSRTACYQFASAFRRTITRARIPERRAAANEKAGSASAILRGSTFEFGVAWRRRSACSVRRLPSRDWLCASWPSWLSIVTWPVYFARLFSRSSLEKLPRTFASARDQSTGLVLRDSTLSLSTVSQSVSIVDCATTRVCVFTLPFFNFVCSSTLWPRDCHLTTNCRANVLVRLKKFRLTWLLRDYVQTAGEEVVRFNRAVIVQRQSFLTLVKRWLERWKARSRREDSFRWIQAA